MSLRKNSFAAGIRDFNTRGAYVIPVRLNKRMKKIIMTMIEEDRSRTSSMFDEDDDESLGRFLQTMHWLEGKMTGNKEFNVRFDAIIAWQLWLFTLDKTFHHLSSEKDFDLAIQWITNQWNKKFSQSKLMPSAEKKMRSLKKMKNEK